MFHDENGSSNNRTKSYTLAATVKKAFAILEFIAEHQPVRAAAIARNLELTRGNVHRLLATLETLGYIEQTADGAYRLTFRVFTLGNSIPETRNLSEAAHPLMQQLSQKSQENVYLVQRYDYNAICVDEVDCPNPLTLHRDLSRTYPLYCSASGKIYLAAMPDDEFETYLSRVTLFPRAERTIMDPEELRRERRRVMEQGYGLELREFSDDLTSVAAPIRNHTHSVIATVSISGPAMRLTDEVVDRLIPDVVATAQEISKMMGFPSSKTPTKGEDRR